MANSILTIDMITREAVQLWRNSNAFIRNVDRQYDDQFARSGAKIGQNLRVRLPNDFTVRKGPAASVQDTSEQSVTLAMSTQAGVDVAFNTQERTLSLDDYSERILAPAVNNTAGQVAVDVMSGTEGGTGNGGAANYVQNVDGSGNLISPTADTYLAAGAVLDLNSAPMGMRKVVNNPVTEARMVSSLTGLLNPMDDISRQYATGHMYTGLGFEWLRDQTAITHLSGTFTAGTVNGANQTGTTLVTNAITGTLKMGDIISIVNVNAVNRITKQSTGQVRQFVVTADVATSATSIPIYPAITPPVGGATVQYQTVNSSPANAAAISLASPANTTYRKNIVYPPQAITMVTADLVMPSKGVEEAAREVFDGISLRMLTAYVVGTDQLITRMDVLYGWLITRPEWLCVVADRV